MGSGVMNLGTPQNPIKVESTDYGCEYDSLDFSFEKVKDD